MGTGVGKPYLFYNESRNMVAQEQRNTCLAACFRQFAEDRGVVIAEEKLITQLVQVFENGIHLEELEKVISIYLPQLRYTLGLFTDSQVLPDLERSISLLRSVDNMHQSSWIAGVLPTPTSKAGHAVIVDRVVGDLVYIRDPWHPEFGVSSGAGIQGVISVTDFAEIWKRAEFGGLYEF